MIYKSVSIKQVVARIIRNTRVQDSSYIIDMNEWIPEAMGYMQTNYELQRRFEDVAINFHKAKLPCDLEMVDAVEYKGHRLHYSSTSKHYATGHNISGQGTTAMQGILTPGIASEYDVDGKVVKSEEQHTNVVHSFAATYEEACKCSVHPSEWFQYEMDYITTSFADGVVRVHYRGVPVDNDGLPLIPDNEDYKEALYWYVRAKMYGAGYEEKQYNERDMMERFEKHAARAIGQITYPTPDMKEQQVKTQVRFIPPANYYDNFFRVDNHERQYGY